MFKLEAISALRQFKKEVAEWTSSRMALEEQIKISTLTKSELNTFFERKNRETTKTLITLGM